jgi:hypothetical protein
MASSMKAQVLEAYNTPYVFKTLPIPPLSSEHDLLVKVDAAGYRIIGMITSHISNSIPFLQVLSYRCCSSCWSDATKSSKLPTHWKPRVCWNGCGTIKFTIRRCKGLSCRNQAWHTWQRLSCLRLLLRMQEPKQRLRGVFVSLPKWIQQRSK